MERLQAIFSLLFMVMVRIVGIRVKVSLSVNMLRVMISVRVTVNVNRATVRMGMENSAYHHIFVHPGWKITPSREVQHRISKISAVYARKLV